MLARRDLTRQFPRRFQGRPLFVLIHVDSPISLRWQRFRTRCEAALLPPPTLESFVLRNDEHHYSPTTGLASLASRAQIKILNTASSLATVYYLSTSARASLLSQKFGLTCTCAACQPNSAHEPTRLLTHTRAIQL